MAPLLSALVAVPGAVFLLAMAFVVVRVFQPTSISIRVAAIFVTGAAIGGVVAAVALSLFIPATLVAAWQVIAYLASLAVGALLSGVLVVVFCIKRRILTLRSSGDPG